DICSRVDRQFRVSDTVNYDGAPGGMTDVNGQLAEAMHDKGYGPALYYEYSCFIPTISALDLPAGTSLFQPIPPIGAPSAFDVYFVSAANHKHVEVPPKIKAFLKKELMGRYQPPPLQMVLVDQSAELRAAASNEAVEWFGPTDRFFGGWQT